MTQDTKLHVLIDSEIELYLKGDRLEIDRLILLSLNRISVTLMEHAEREEQVTEKLNGIGGLEAVCKRAAYVDLLIEGQKKRNEALSKIAQSTAVGALLVVLGFIGKAIWEAVVHLIKTKTGV